MGHPRHINMQHGHRPDDASESDSENDVPVDAGRFPEIAMARPGAFSTRELPLPRNTRRLLPASNNPGTNPTNYAYAVNIPPLNLRAAPSPLRAFQVREHLRRSSFDAGYSLSQQSPTTSFPHQSPGAASTPVSALLYQPRTVHLRETPAFASPIPRRHSDQTVPSFRLRAAKWIDGPSRSPSPGTGPSTPGLSDGFPATPSPNVPPATRPGHVRSKSDISEASDPQPGSLVHRRMKSSDRVSPYPPSTAVSVDPGSTSEPAPEVKEKRRRTVKQRIRWIEVSPGVSSPTSSTTPAEAVATNPDTGLPNGKPPPRRIPANTPVYKLSKPWKEAQIKIDLRLEPPAAFIPHLGLKQFKSQSGPSVPFYPAGYPPQNNMAESPVRQMSVPPISTLENEAGPSSLNTRAKGSGVRSQKGRGNGKEKQPDESSDHQMDIGMDIEPGVAGRAWLYPWQERRVGGRSDDVDMLVDDRPVQVVAPTGPPSRQSRMRWVYAQATTDNDATENNWGHAMNAMRSTRVHQAGDVTWAYTRFDTQACGRGLNPANGNVGSTMSSNRSPAGRCAEGRETMPLAGGISQPSENVFVKQEVDGDERIPPFLLSAHGLLLKQELVEDIRSSTVPTSVSHPHIHPAYRRQIVYPLAHHRHLHLPAPPPFPHFDPTTRPADILTGTQQFHHIQQTFDNSTPAHPNPPSQPITPPIPLPTANHDDPSHILNDTTANHLPSTRLLEPTQTARLEERVRERTSPSNGKGLKEEEENETAAKEQSLEAAKGIVMPDAEPSPRESPMIETPTEPLAVQEMMHCMVDIERESEQLRQKLSRLPLRSSPEPPCSVTKPDATTTGISSSDFAEYELEEGEIMED